MRKFVRFLLFKPILWITQTFASAPDRDRIFEALTKLKERLEATSGRKGFTIPFDTTTHKFIIFSDQHKGRRNGADDFANAEPNYLAALKHYYQNDFHLVSLGDSEELWENTLLQVRKHNKEVFEAEGLFASRSRFTKIFGNHDLDWQIDPLAPVFLKEIYQADVAVMEGVMLQTTVSDQVVSILCTHGHQGDRASDGNWLSKFIVAKIWAPLQAYVKINPNTPAYDALLKTEHNRLMYEWSAAQRNLLLITGHTHQPVFESLTHIERVHRKNSLSLLEQNREWAEAIELESSWTHRDVQTVRPNYLMLRPSYFNSGCCCFEDGDITGIEIESGFIRLIKWEVVDNISQRIVLEERALTDIVADLKKYNTDVR